MTGYKQSLKKKFAQAALLMCPQGEGAVPAWQRGWLEALIAIFHYCRLQLSQRMTKIEFPASQQLWIMSDNRNDLYMDYLLTSCQIVTDALDFLILT